MKNILGSFVALLILIVSPSVLAAIGVDLGPFSLRLNSDVQVRTPAFEFYNNPICQAIMEHHLIAMQVRKKGEMQKIVLEPYAFGYTESGELTLQGYQVEQVKLNDSGDDSDGKGFFGGIFSSFEGNDWVNVDIDRVIDIQVLRDSHFEIRDEILDNVSDENRIVDPICLIK